MPPGDWQTFDEILPGMRAKCVCGTPLRQGGGVRICPNCKLRLWVHASIIVEVERR